MMIKIEDYISKKEMRKFCQKNHIIKMSLFGSALGGDWKAGSDIDILVEFDKKHMPGLFEIAGMEIELSEIFSRKVDLRTPAELSRYFRDDVIKQARVEYAV